MAPRTAQVDPFNVPQPPVDAPQQPAGASLTSRFSDEIWLRTFAQLEYYALKKVQRVCKKFQRLVQDKILDDALFRAGPVAGKKGKLEVGMQFALHPHIASTHVLQRSRWLSSAAESLKRAAKTGGLTSWKPGDARVSCAPDFYGPSVGRETKHTHAVLTKPGGVTVGDVFTALGTWFNTRAPKAVAEEMDYGSVAGKRSVLNEEMAEECYWEGWQDPVVRADESKKPVLSVYLEAVPYGH